MNRHQKRPFLAGFVLIAISAICVLLLNTVLKDWLIIGFGVRFYQNALACAAMFTIGTVLATIVFNIPFLRWKLQQHRQQKQQTQFEAEYQRDGTKPEHVRQRLEQLAQDLPSFHGLVERCLQQMDRMDALQNRQAQLIKDNDALYLKDTVEVLDNVERRLCQNLRNVINLCIAAGGADSYDWAKSDRYLDENDNNLTSTKELLRVSVNWINQYNTDRACDRSEIEHWIATIQESLKEE